MYKKSSESVSKPTFWPHLPTQLCIDPLVAAYTQDFEDDRSQGNTGIYTHNFLPLRDICQHTI